MSIALPLGRFFLTEYTGRTRDGRGGRRRPLSGPRGYGGVLYTPVPYTSYEALICTWYIAHPRRTRAKNLKQVSTRTPPKPAGHQPSRSTHKIPHKSMYFPRVSPFRLLDPPVASNVPTETNLIPLLRCAPSRMRMIVCIRVRPYTRVRRFQMAAPYL